MSAHRPITCSAGAQNRRVGVKMHSQRRLTTEVTDSQLYQDIAKGVRHFWAKRAMDGRFPPQTATNY